MKKNIIIIIGIIQCVLGALFFTSCEEDELTQMARLYKDESGQDYIKHDHFSLGEYDKCKVVLFHKKHEKNLLWTDIGYIKLGNDVVWFPWGLSTYVVYNEEVQKIKDLEEAYDLVWINDDELELIIEESVKKIKEINSEYGCC